MTTPITVCMAPESLAALIRGYRFIVGNESAFQDGFLRMLEENQIKHLREHDLGRSFGRIDFYLPDHGIGIELKVKGSRTEVLRQLHRYSLCPEVQALILVTGWTRLAPTAAKLNGKPLVTACIWQGQL